jgi:hypothetical protein
MKNEIPIESLSRNIRAIVIKLFLRQLYFSLLRVHKRARTHTSYEMLQCRKFLYFMLMTRFYISLFRIICIAPENDRTTYLFCQFYFRYFQKKMKENMHAFSEMVAEEFTIFLSLFFRLLSTSFYSAAAAAVRRYYLCREGKTVQTLF